MSYHWWPVCLPNAQSVAFYVYNELKVMFQINFLEDVAIANAFRNLDVPTRAMSLRDLGERTKRAFLAYERQGARDRQLRADY